MKRLTLIALATGFSCALNVMAAEGAITNTEPQWATPARWREITPGPAMAKAYSPLPDSAKAIIVTVNHFCLAAG